MREGGGIGGEWRRVEGRGGREAGSFNSFSARAEDLLGELGLILSAPEQETLGRLLRTSAVAVESTAGSSGTSAAAAAATTATAASAAAVAPTNAAAAYAAAVALTDAAATSAAAVAPTDAAAASAAAVAPTDAAAAPAVADQAPPAVELALVPCALDNDDAQANLQRKLERARMQLRLHRQRACRLAVALAKEQATSAKLKKELQEHRFHRGRRNHKLSTRGGLLLAARRTLCNVGSQGVGAMLGLDVHGDTIRSWEVSRGGRRFDTNTTIQHSSSF